MAYNIGDRITASDIVNYAYDRIMNAITANCRTASTIPTSPMGNKVVPVKHLASSYNFARPNIGSRGSKIKGKDNGTSYNPGITTMSVYNALVYLTKQLLSVGTYTYKERKVYTKVNDTKYYYKNEWSSSGKCIFNSSTVYQYFNVNSFTNLPLVSNLSTGAPPVDGGVVTPNKITISGLNALCTNCINAYNVSTKLHCDFVYSQCHENCHVDCNCNCNCNCHTFENCNFNNHWAAEHDPNYQCEVCQCYCNDPWTYGDLPDNGSDPGCNSGTCDGTFTCHNNTIESIRIYTYTGNPPAGSNTDSSCNMSSLKPWTANSLGDLNDIIKK